HLSLVGDGPLRPQIEAAFRASGQDGAVTLTGWLDEAGVRRVLGESHALVLPSFAEGLPMVLMEALAAGRPVIATHIAGIPELVTPDVGWLVPAGDDEALAAAMAALSRIPQDELAAMGRAGHDRALMRHDIDRAAARLAALFAGSGEI
ncbi:MAG: glycosyltransferase, partial [Paracoccus sp. (in: a-proteobacteria)]|nr:glycosyltransferase [Paracoccus sp. (in: a-proteobacteria)]